MPVPLGLHFWDRRRERGPLAGLRVPLVDVAWCREAHAGFDLRASLERLATDCSLLYDTPRPGDRAHPMPYLRLDYAPGLTLLDTRDYYDAAAEAMRWWTGDPRAPLTLICGNEPNHPQEGAIPPAAAAVVVRKVAELRDLLGVPVRVFAPAVAPWCPINVESPEDVSRPAGAPCKNQQFGLARRLRDAGIDGYALHTYGRDLTRYGAAEPRTDYLDAGGQGQWGFRWWEDALAAIRAADPRGLPIAVTEVNTRIDDRPSSESYRAGWLTAALDELGACQQVEAVCWFVGEPHGHTWVGDSLKERLGNCAVADDEFNQLLERARSQAS